MSVVTDPEIHVMAALIAELDALPPATAIRVLVWALSRYKAVQKAIQAQEASFSARPSLPTKIQSTRTDIRKLLSEAKK